MTVRGRVLAPSATSTPSSGQASEAVKENGTRRATRRKRREKNLKISPIAALFATATAAFLASNFLLGRTIEFSDKDPLHSIVKPSTLRKGWIPQDAQPFNQEQVASKANHLIVVAGHSAIISGHLQDAGEDETDWYLLDYQKGQGLPQAIKAHILAGIQECASDPESMLIFSGGETRALTGPASEGPSYFHAADAMELWPHHSNVRARTTTEEFATDSFQNLMFSICRFMEVTGHYPTKITTVSFSFKQRRFKTLHAKALRWPSEKFVFIGVDPHPDTGFDLERSTKGELENAVRPFETDPYGCNQALLRQKRLDRNPFSRTAPYPLSCPAMKTLLAWCGPDLIPVAEVPWGRQS